VKLAVSRVVPPATSEQVAVSVCELIAVTVVVFAVIEYDPAATFAIVATVTSVVDSAWIPSR
jgi:hypothetical protein